MGTKGTILLTGPNGGIGIGFITQLLKSSCATSHTTIYAVRSPTSAHALNSLLKTAPKAHNHLVLPVDLSSLSNIRKFAADINARIASGSIPPIQALIHGAGIEDCTREHFTEDGYERTFAVNYLSNFLLTLLLLQSMDKSHGRIMYLSSTTSDLDWWINKGVYASEEQRRTQITSPEKMAKGVEEVPDGEFGFKTGIKRYALSKLLLIQWMYELQRRLNTDPQLSSISIIGLDPGWIGSTGITRNLPLASHIFLRIVSFLSHFTIRLSFNPLLRTATSNGDDMLELCFGNRFGEWPKAKYVNGKVEKDPHVFTKDEEGQRRLWKGSLELAGVREGEIVLRDWR